MCKLRAAWKGDGFRRNRTFETISCWAFGKASLHWCGTVLGPAVWWQCSVPFDRRSVLSLRPLLSPVILVFGEIEVGGSQVQGWRGATKPCGRRETLSGQGACLRSHSKSRDREPGSGRGHCGRLSMVPLTVASPIESLRDRTGAPREPGQ